MGKCLLSNDFAAFSLNLSYRNNKNDQTQTTFQIIWAVIGRIRNERELYWVLQACKRVMAEVSVL